uniref:Uncharacterized protein n=1 Tax=Picea glauca TaxID=3330 RepID=A0A101M2Z2_PICGL|nr:hypothetical protein ABT39_MTgene3329 [Picea glauca]
MPRGLDLKGTLNETAVLPFPPLLLPLLMPLLVVDEFLQGKNPVNWINYKAIYGHWHGIFTK